MCDLGIPCGKPTCPLMRTHEVIDAKRMGRLEKMRKATERQKEATRERERRAQLAASHEQDNAGYGAASAWRPWDDGCRRAPGMLVRYDDGRIELVGDMNEQGGTCDCCTGHEKIIEYSTELYGVIKSAVDRKGKESVT